MKILKKMFIWMCSMTCLFGSGDSVSGLEYFDLGAWQTWNFMDWSKGEVNIVALDTYVDSFSSSLKGQHISQVMLSFAQVGDIINLSNEKYSDLSDSDAIGMLYKNTGGKRINDKQVIDYIVSRFVKNGIMVGISFGGASAQDIDWDFGFDANDPSDLAIALASWAGKVGFTTIDFDVENAAFSKNDPQKLSLFFNGLQKAFTGSGVTLTVMGDVNHWGVNGPIFGSMFKDNPLQTMFTGINLMLYNGQYYLNAGQTPIQSWDLFLWMSQLKENMKLSYVDVSKYINVGFNSKIDYRLEKSSGGPLPYTSMPTAISSGSAAVYIYNTLIASLTTLSKEGVVLGTPFFWDDNADYTVSAVNNYTSQFFANTDNFESDFFGDSIDN